jgi:amylovoran biosynthesis glycosyltransferase AmsE
MINQKFSVLLPIYNRSELQQTFPTCLEAIADNTTLPSEVVIVCDGPLDWDIDGQIAPYQGLLNIKLVKLEKNVGLARALNIGIENCEYDIIARVDSDDFCRFDRFEKQLFYINKGFNLVGSNIQEVDGNGKSLMIRAVPEQSQEILDFALRRNPFNHMTVMYRKQNLIRVGLYPDFYLKEDYALWCQMLSQPWIRPFNIQECLMKVTAGEGMYARRSSLRIFSQELKMQLFLRRTLKKRGSLILIDFLFRVIFHLIPPKAKSVFYAKFLRN